MNILFYILSGAFGIIIGSFLNVLILRYNTGKGLGGRSQCLSCSEPLQAVDLVPVLSYLWHEGRCRTCKSRISKQYIIVELLTGFLFVLAWHHNAYLFGLGTVSFAGGFVDQIMWPIVSLGLAPVGLLVAMSHLVIDFLIMSTLVFMAGYDLRHKIIPDPSVIVFGLLALAGQLVLGTLGWNIFFAGIILAIPFYLIWLLSGGEWMGLGDAKLALGIGWLLGLSLGGTAIIFGFWIGAAISVGLLIIQKLMKIDSLRRFLHRMHIPRLTFKSEVPFAPFLIAGLLIVYVLGYNLFAFTL